MSNIVSRSLVALAISAASAAAAPLPPFDFTGHWTGVVLAGSEAFDFEADLITTGPKTFEGEVDVEGVPCLVRGKRKQTVKVRLRCADGTKGKFKALLDLENEALVGSGRLKKSGRKVPADIAIEKVVPAVCGNTALEAGEQCDDGNTVSGDGCDAACRIEVMIVTELDEIEPNGVPGQATDVTALPALAHGAVAPGGDEDFYRVVITGSDLVLETFDAGGPGSCADGTDTVLELRGANGTSVVGVDDDDGPGLCSRLELHGLPPGVYFPCVRSFDSATGVPAYQLRMIGG